MTGAEQPSPISADAAWDCVLGVQPGSVGSDDPLLRPLGGSGDPEGEVGPGGAVGSGASLTIHADGSWHVSAPVTEEAARTLDIFLPLRLPERLVVGQLGQSLDGRIATASGHSHYINGPEDIRRLHALRALVDAVVVGPGTVASDNPQLTVRHVAGPNPVRVVLDPRGTLGPEAAVFTDGAAPTLWIRPLGNPAPQADGLDQRVGQIELSPGEDGAFPPRAVVAALAERGLHRILVEGGGRTVSAFLQAGQLDRLHVSVAPLLIGSGRPGITLPVIDTLDEALRPRVRHFVLGTDLLFDLELGTG